MKAVPLASAALASVVHRFPDTVGKDAGRVVSLQHEAPATRTASGRTGLAIRNAAVRPALA
jgi:hypothetical protein